MVIGRHATEDASRTAASPVLPEDLVINLPRLSRPAPRIACATKSATSRCLSVSTRASTCRNGRRAADRENLFDPAREVVTPEVARQTLAGSAASSPVNSFNVRARAPSRPSPVKTNACESRTGISRYFVRCRHATSGGAQLEPTDLAMRLFSAREQCGFGRRRSPNTSGTRRRTAEVGTSSRASGLPRDRFRASRSPQRRPLRERLGSSRCDR